jgi:hypothetical protein
MSKHPKGGEPRIREILLHRRRTFYILGVDDHYFSKVLLRQKPSDLFPGTLENGIVGVHPMQVVIERDHSEFLLV